jgi:hypothetical protein
MPTHLRDAHGFGGNSPLRRSMTGGHGGGGIRPSPPAQ